MKDKYKLGNEQLDRIPLRKFDFSADKIFTQGFDDSLKKEEIEFVRNKIADRWESLDNKAHEAELNAERFLFTISFGGIIGLITLFRLYPGLHDSIFAKLSFMLLFLVCMLVGVLKALRVIRDYEKKAGFEKDMLAFYNNEISFNKLQHRDFYRLRKQKLREAFAWISFALYGVALLSLMYAIYAHVDFTKDQQIQDSTPTTTTKAPAAETKT